MDPLTLGLMFAGSSLFQGLSSIFGSQQAAGAQTAAASQASSLQAAMFNMVMQKLQPFITGAQNIMPDLTAAGQGLLSQGGDVLAQGSNMIANAPGLTAPSQAAGMDIIGTGKGVLDLANPILGAGGSVLATGGGVLGTALPGFTSAINTLTGAIPGLTSTLPPVSTEEAKNTPGYQFMLQQGLKDTQSGYAAKGLGSSGAAIKGGAEFETNLAQTTLPAWINTLLNIQQQNLGQRQQIANILTGAISPWASLTGAGTNILGAGTGVLGAGSNVLGAGSSVLGAGTSLDLGSLQALASLFGVGTTQQQTGLNAENMGANIWNSIFGGGLGAANALGGFGTTAGTNIGANTVGAGNAQAAATMTGFNALGAIPGNAMNQYLQYGLANALMGKLGTTPTTPTPAAPSPAAFANVGNPLAFGGGAAAPGSYSVGSPMGAPFQGYGLPYSGGVPGLSGA